MTKSGSSTKSLMTPVAASRIQRATTLTNGGQVSSKSFAARAMSAGATNAKASAVNATRGSQDGKS